MKSKINITSVRKFDKFKVLSIIRLMNIWKRKIKWLASLNPYMLFFGYFIFLIIPYIPNIPLYLILLNKRISKWVKWVCLTLSVLTSIVYNILIVYLLTKI